MNGDEEDLSELYGAPEAPTFVKPHEMDAAGAVLRNPDFQVINPGRAPNLSGVDRFGGPKRWIWAIDQEGNLVIGSEEPVGGIIPATGYQPRLGHPTLTNRQPARIAGELRQNANGTWYINNRSGRYSDHPDRTAGKLARVNQLFRNAGLKMSDPRYSRT
jgi:hypothetical protein